MKEKIILEVRGLYRGSELPGFNRRKDGPGIYIWGITESETSNKFVPLYVGTDAKSVWHRVEEHFLSLHYGNRYRIFSNDFYEKLFRGQSIVPKKPHVEVESFYGYCVFSCDPKEDPYMKNKATFVNYKAKVITSQGLDYRMKNSREYQPIQDAIEKYYSKERFAFLTLLLPEDSNIKPRWRGIEANVKFALRRGTLSRSDNFDTGLKIKLIPKLKKNSKGKPSQSLNDLVRKLFLLKNDWLEPSNECDPPYQISSTGS